MKISKISKKTNPVLNEKALETQRGDVPNVINEKQLDSYRATEQDVTIEKLLEKNRTGDAGQIVERQLDTHKAKFNSKYRNKEAHTGNMNKLEEKRLKNNPVEKEKYEPASSTPKKFRWWEDKKGEDGLKLASKESKVVVSQKEELDFDNPSYTNIPDVENSDSLDFEIDDISNIGENVVEQPEIHVIKEKALPNPSKPYLSGLFMELGFNPSEFGYDEEKIKDAVVNKILLDKPELSRFLSTEDLSGLQMEGDEGSVKLRLVGDFLAPILEKKPDTSITPPQPIQPVNEPINESVEEPITSDEPVNTDDNFDVTEEGSAEDVTTEDITEEGDFEVVEEDSVVQEVKFNKVDIDGTPMAIGEIEFDPEEIDPKSAIRNSLNLIQEKHPELQVEQNSLDLSDISIGVIRYMVGIME